MYIGGTDEHALHHLTAEALDNAMDEAVAGHASWIDVELHADGSVTLQEEMIEVDSLQWGSDYPHMESTFHGSQQILEEILVDCTEEEKAKIAGGNAARIYKV